MVVKTMTDRKEWGFRIKIGTRSMNSFAPWNYEYQRKLQGREIKSQPTLFTKKTHNKTVDYVFLHISRKCLFYFGAVAFLFQICHRLCITLSCEKSFIDEYFYRHMIWFKKRFTGSLSNELLMFQNTVTSECVSKNLKLMKILKSKQYA